MRILTQFATILLLCLISISSNAQFSADTDIRLNDKIESLESQMNLRKDDKAFMTLADKLMAIYDATKMNVTLYDQAPPYASTGIVATELSGVGHTYTADEFEIPAGEQWEISEIFAPGFLSLGSVNPDGVKVLFYNDDNGIPGALINEQSLSSFIFTGDFMININPVNLIPGKYWMAVAAIFNAPSITSARWNWYTSTQIIGDEFHLEDTGFFGGFTWTSASTLGVTDRSSVFMINGVSSPYSPDSAEAIPTMGQWGLIALSCLILIIGISYLKQSEFSFEKI